MGNKGSTVTTNQSQTYTPNEPIGGAINQAISGAESAANQPFQQPVAPVAGFTPDQLQAFQQIRNTQGMSQPYFDAGQSYLQNSAAPISGADVNQYYNPMAENVTRQMNNIFGQQQRNTTGQLTQAAGGVGADRIAVGQSELANQQGLAAGQTYANLYQQALQAAQQQKQMEAGAGFGIAQMGPAAQNSALQGTTALGQSGAQQQGLTQAQKTAQYQNILAKIAYQFQTPQYLAGITAGLAPAAGGTTQGQSTTTYPSPSPLAQALGIGTAGIGLAGGFGGAGGLGMKGSYGGNPITMASRGGGDTGLVGLDPSAMFMADGGAAPSYGKLAESIGKNWAGNPYAPQNFADGGEVPEESRNPFNIQGLPFPGAGQIPKGVVPTISLPPGGGHSGPMTGGLNLYHQPMSQASQSNTSSDMVNAMKLAALMGGMARGGTVYPKHFADGGGDDTPEFDEFAVQRRMAGDKAPSFPPSSNMGPPIVYDKSAMDGSPVGWQGPVPPEGFTPPPPKPTASAVARAPATGGITPRRGGMNADMSPEQYFMPKERLPYPDATQRDWGQNLARSPWMSLVKAGAEMASTTGPIGSVIGKGIKAGAGELESQRKELRSEQDHNQKADALWQRAKVELDKYQRKTPHELATEGFRAQSLALGKYQAVNYTGEDGKTAVGVFDAKRGIVIDPMTREPVHATNIQRRTTTGGIDKTGTLTLNQALLAVQKDPNSAGLDINKQLELARKIAGQPGAAAPAAETPKIGDRKQFKQGFGVWDGSKWVPEGQ